MASIAPLRLPGVHANPALAKFAGASRSADTVDAGPQVDVVKEGDRVVRLVVTCGCGERVEIDCLYAAGA